MKISKEGHKRTAVAVKKNQVGGVVYKVPGGAEEDLSKNLAKRSEDVKRLYNIFNQGSKGKTQKSNYELYAGKVNSVLKRMLFSDGRPKKILPDDQILAKMKSQKALPPYRGNLEDFILMTLRKSLVVSTFKGKRFDSRKAVLAFLKNIENGKPTAADEQQIRTLLALIREDYNKWDPKETNGLKVMRSIKNQNMLIQPEEAKLSLSKISNEGKMTSTKQTEKEGLESFLTAYAQIDEKSRMMDLRKLRHLLDTYFATPEAYPKGEIAVSPKDIEFPAEMTVWERHEAAKKVDTDFVKVPKVLRKAEQDDKSIDKAEKKRALEELKTDIRRRNIACYRYANQMAANEENRELYFADAAINQYWIHHIENAVERILKKCTVGTLFKLRTGYLSEKVWKDALNLLSIKYIALGKAVYHFTMDSIWSEDAKKAPGTINSPALKGISSFDYEMIKAQEDLQRELSVGVAFSANNLARASCQMDNVADGKSDFLLWNEEDIQNYAKSSDQREMLSAILQFFGGISSWDVELFENAYAASKSKHGYGQQFLTDLKRAIYAARNENFHFKTAVIDKGSWNMQLFGSLFEKEAETCLQVEKNKFYSNNLALFYTQQDLRSVLDKLYGKECDRAAQIPSYGTILPRKSFPDFLKQLPEMKEPAYNPAVRDQWYSACYYLLKEVYYNLFLQDAGAKALFGEAVQNLKGDENQDAINNFRDRYREIANAHSLAEICQSYMTEYNQQNNQNRRVQSAKENERHKPIYQHYRMLLNEALRTAFASYIKKCKDLAFVCHPVQKPLEVSLEAFLPDWRSAKYESLISEVKKSGDLQKWYIVGKFMNARTLNLLLGSMRSYLQYVNDIQRRAAGLGGQQLHLSAGNAERVKKCIQVLELCLLLSVRISNEYTDYFKDEEEYASYLKGYVDFRDSAMPSEYSALLSFSNEEEHKIDLYVDASNPKVNRNIIQAKLYAPDTILKKTVKKVSRDECLELYQKKEEILQIKNKGDAVSWEEQQRILAYQKLKNRVELRDLSEYGELINELLGQLINWSYLRERDLLYFQLGFHYSCLTNESEKPEAYRTICTDKTRIENAILYQIIAMYINGYSVYAPDKEKRIEEKKETRTGGAGSKISAFCEWASTIEKEQYGLYNAGLELFEVVKEHDNVVDLRKKIDHFKYYQGRDSILALYGEVFDRFFTYDMKYRKNVLNLLQNILLRHNVLIKPIISKGVKVIGSGDEKTKKDRAAFLLEEISSDEFTYKVKEGEKKIDAKNELYLETVRDILYFADKCGKSKDVKVCSRSPKDFKENADKGKKPDRNERNNWKKGKDTRGQQTGKQERLSFNPFAGISLD